MTTKEKKGRFASLKVERARLRDENTQLKRKPGLAGKTGVRITDTDCELPEAGDMCQRSYDLCRGRVDVNSRQKDIRDSIL